jgi:PAS domain S-box-containing protein
MNDSVEIRKKNIIWIRVILTLIIILLAIYNIFDIIESKQYIFFYLFVLILSNIFFIFLPIKFFEGTKILYVIFVMDIIFISLAAYWLAFLDFQFFIMIFLTVFVSALGQSVYLSLVIAFVIDFIYVYLKITGGGSGLNILLEQDILLNLPFIFIVALYGSYLAEKAQQDLLEKEKLEIANKALSQKIKDIDIEKDNITEIINNIFNSFREGIIIIDNDGLIIFFNSKCETLFNLHKSKVINVNYTEIEALGDVQKILYEIHYKKLPSFDKKIEIQVGGIKKSIIVNTANIKDKNGNVYGALCVLRQILTDLKGDQ